MKILSVKDPAFRKYGRVITNVDFTQLVEEMKKTPVPDGVVYEPGINALEALPVKKELETITYGEMDPHYRGSPARISSAMPF